MDMMSYLMGRNSGGGGKGAKIEVVTELPETGEANVIYLVPKETEDENNVFDEYLYINDEWELIGSTAIDISGKQDTMQFSTMPTASADYLGRIVQYTGTTNANYINGYFYVCVGTTENDVTTYSWSNVEVQEKSSNAPLYTASLEVGGASSEWPSEGTLGTNDKLILQNIINDAYKKGFEFINLIVTKSSQKAEPVTFNCGYKDRCNIQTKPTRIWLYALATDQRFIDGYTQELPYISSFQFVINLSWSNDTVSVSSGTFYKTKGYFLTTTNGTVYTPTSNYHPATKKYVDDSIAAAITTTLGGSY